MKAIIFHACAFCASLFLTSSVVMAASPHLGHGAISGGAILVDEATIVKLAGLYIPGFLEKEAKARLEMFSTGKMLRLTRVSQTTDRHGRLLALVYGDNKTLLQSQVIAEGLAVWDGSEKTAPQAEHWLLLETEAEAKQLGIWKSPQRFIAPDTKAQALAGDFALIEGEVRTVTRRGERIYLNFGEDWRKDFTLLIEPKYQKSFDLDWLSSLQRKKIRVRGYVFLKSGAMIELRTPKQIQVGSKEPDGT